ncbi:hypothetical protein BP00DRAFT_476213 [Aspergillus indologenus CBS 114.80]|uniref:Uncharacterized protein n=1 Tax=Aspergillus indologenus CBS 114.80 TaxID=1450541 RepID=A0A2V5IGE5_9EURO|nr:hypothetical protein BP00DRAFT_476213 [Aspergillus indologenus CBS 114.80]
MGLLPMKSYYRWFGFSKTRTSKEDHSCRFLDDALIHSNNSCWSLSELAPTKFEDRGRHYVSVEHALRAAEHIDDMSDGEWSEGRRPYQKPPKKYENREEKFPTGKNYREGPLYPEITMWEKGMPPGPARIIGPEKEHEPRCRNRPTHWKLSTFWKPCWHNQRKGHDGINMDPATYRSATGLPQRPISAPT